MICLAGVAAGMAAAAAGFVWSQFAKPQYVWSAEQAQEYAAASEALHAATVGHDHADHAHDAADSEASHDHPPADITAARERFEKIDAELQAARQVQTQLGPRLMQFGLVATILFGLGYLASRGE